MKTRFITLSPEIEEIITSCEACYVGMIDPENKPYTLPFNFGFENETLYLHGAPTGRKMEALKNNPLVCVAFSSNHQMYQRNENVACSYGMKYKSVLIEGKIEFVDDYDEKVRILNIIMRQYTKRDDFKYNAPAVNNITVMRVVESSISAKAFGY